jgi:hypothetical protein
MLLYPLEEAISLLSAKLTAAKRNLEETIEDLEWLREQSTVMEVNFARVHNVSLFFLGLAISGRLLRGVADELVGCETS